MMACTHENVVVVYGMTYCEDCSITLYEEVKKDD